jgi:heme exporter protein CcmD
VKDYTFYIASAYGFAAVVVGAVVLKIAFDYRALRRKLARFNRGEQDR